MTTPQNILHDIEDKLRILVRLLEGERGADEDNEDIYEMCKGIEIEVCEFDKRMELLEDKMNLIIKLLGKSE